MIIQFGFYDVKVCIKFKTQYIVDLYQYLCYMYALLMGRKKNQIESVHLTLATTQPVIDYLEDIVSTGLHGENPSEAAEELIRHGVARLIENGTITKRTPPNG